MSEENLQAASLTEEAPRTAAQRPDYISEAYWDGKQVDVQKLADDLRSSNKRVEDLRRILSTPKEPEPYEALFDGRELNDAQKADMSVYVKLARKNGLSKKQAEQLYDDVNEVVTKNQKQYYENLINSTKQELGNEYQTISEGLQSFAKQKVSAGKWSEQDLQDFADMAFNARSMRILAELVQNQPGMDLSGQNNPSQGEQSLEREYYDLNRTYHDLLKRGHGDDPHTQEIKLRLNKKRAEYNQMIDDQGVLNDL